MNEKEIEEYAQRRAMEVCSCGDGECDLRRSLITGFSAGREIGRLEGELHSLLEGGHDDEAESVEEQLKALLGSVKVES